MTYLPQQSWLKRFRLVLISPLLVVALSLSFNQKQQGVAEPFERFVPLAARSPAWVPTIAQASLPVQITRHGNQVVLNGRRVSMPWSQQQQLLGIADAGLVSELGLELLDSNSPQQQPVSWFSDSLKLNSWLTKQYRYLDLASLQQQFGWQVELRGAELQISTPAAQITGLQQGAQAWGDRLVVNLDRATPWQLSENQGESVLAIDAQSDPKTLGRLQTGQNLTGFKLEASGKRTLLRLSYAGGLRPRVWTLSNPNRIVIDLRPDAMPERDILWAPGLRWQQQWVNLGNSRFPVVGLEIDPRQSGLSLRPMLSGTNNVGTAPLSATAQRAQGIAAINGGFFNRNNRLPLGAIRSGERWISGPILNRGALGWNDSGEVTVGRLKLQETLTVGSQKRLMQSTNSGYVGAGVARYTPDWGSSYSSIIDNETLVTVQNSQVVSQKQVAKAGQATAIPSDGYLLVVRADADAPKLLAVGTQLEVTAETLPDEFNQFAQVMGAGPLLIKNRQMVLDAPSEQFSANFMQEAAPRSVIATTAQGKLLLLTVHNRVNGAGPTLSEVAGVMQQIGAVDALNLDGGSSTTLYLGGQILNRTPSSTASVSNGIGVFIQP
jgi:exopolysaccharide biosynthesis protein